MSSLEPVPDHRVFHKAHGHRDGQASLCRQQQSHAPGIRSMKLVWIIGSGGLLGSSLCRNFQQNGNQLFAPQTRFAWGDPTELHRQFALAVSGFGEMTASADEWEIYWAAGLGTMGCVVKTLAPETNALAQFLQLVTAELHLKGKPGTIVFASSAGAIYAGSKDTVIDESTAPAPTTAYAQE